MKNKIKDVSVLIMCIIISFIFIYLFVFAGGWKLVESGDPILLEFAASIVVGFMIFIIFKITKYYDTKIKKLEKRIEELENK